MEMAEKIDIKLPTSWQTVLMLW